MRVPLSAAVTLGLLFFLSVGLNEQVVEGCRCMQTSPKQQYCESGTVIRAQITGEVKSNNEETTYGIILIKTFKQNDEKPVQFIHSYKNSCGVTLEKGEYLLGGKIINYLRSDFALKLNTLISGAGCEHLLRLEYTTPICSLNELTVFAESQSQSADFGQFELTDFTDNCMVYSIIQPQLFSFRLIPSSTFLGSAKDGVMEVNLCSLVKDWNSLSSVPVSEWL